nr:MULTISPECIES: hypothetical protein [unclassified Rhodococcus (in: high G+C Gram-positive bacteria)]
MDSIVLRDSGLRLRSVDNYISLPAPDCAEAPWGHFSHRRAMRPPSTLLR